MLLLLIACAGTGGDSGSDTCADAPVVTWDSHGHALLQRHCQPCHASTAVNRFGAPAEVTFDTREQALALSDAILRTATGDDPSMPPAVAITDTDKALLEIWLTCWE
jgi:uncharacterized membrane protein